MNLNKVLRVFLSCGVAAVLPCVARPQQQQSAPQRPSTDIVKDNLDRVAATPDQILEVLAKDPGLMVELKQLLARDAGASGQILEESDLHEEAIADRLRQDLRTRVLATRLLRRYGYLLPRVNPDSDLAAEHNLMLRERAQEIQRASQRRGTVAPAPREERTSACDASHSAPCLPQDRFPEDTPLDTFRGNEIRSPEEPSTDQDRLAPSTIRTAEDGAPDGSRADGFTTWSGLDANFVPTSASDRAPQAMPGSSAESRFDASSSVAAPTAAADAISPPLLAFPEFPPRLRRNFPPR